jgi:hypothetical protein
MLSPPLTSSELYGFGAEGEGPSEFGGGILKLATFYESTGVSLWV